ncbi:hydrogenase nickel incorporation protein HypB [Chloroflexus sp.]|uniref:hydrogenase nickel incorporation protein HypB n=1 Tax=Chloroflexus sp. TaxID=1904827 RepID=UPI002ADD40D9|nr:hydrogenase nickel incorporation protein HypB [Chloroflexus sp.]
MTYETKRLIEIRQGVLNKNDQLAAALRHRFHAAGVTVVNLLSSPGAGKTSLLEATMRMMLAECRVAALVGDLATDNDARRLARSGGLVRQIQTGDMCHLEADIVARHLADWDLNQIDLLFIENVGNLVCPAGYDLGEAVRVVLLSTTEGEDKPLKYPATFATADAVILTKMDLAEPVGFDRVSAENNIRAVNPLAPIIATSARSEAGLQEWLNWLRDQMRTRSSNAKTPSA